MILLQRLFIAASLLTIVSCSSVSMKDCDSSALYAKGLSDGKSGKSGDQYERIENSCSSHGMTTTADSYQYGRKVGLADYCSESRAKSDAKNGKAEEVCIQEQFPPYQKAYDLALIENRNEQTKNLEKIQKDEEKLKKKEYKARSDLQNMPAPSTAQ